MRAGDVRLGGTGPKVRPVAVLTRRSRGVAILGLVVLSACTRLGFDMALDPTPNAASDATPNAASDATPDGRSALQDSDLQDSDLQVSANVAGSLLNAGVGPLFRLFFGMADNIISPPPVAHIKELEFNAETNAVVDRGFVETTPGPLKALDLNRELQLTLAHYLPRPFTLDLVAISPALRLFGELGLSHELNPSLAIEHAHALCVLPGGNLVVAAGTNYVVNYLNEYTPAGQLIRLVRTSTLHTDGSARVISCCISRSDLELYAHETVINARDGQLLRLVRAHADADWTVADSVRTLEVAARLGFTGVATWTFALDQKNELIYIAPYGPSASSMNQLIRCPARSFDVSSCTGVGEMVPGATTSGGSIIKSLVQIPGTDDLLALNHGGSTVPAARKLYRFNSASGSWTMLFDLAQISGGYAQPQGYPVLRTIE